MGVAQETDEQLSVVRRVQEAGRSLAEVLAPVQIGISILVAVGILVGSRSTGLSAVLTLLAFLEHAISLPWVRAGGAVLVISTTVISAGREDPPAGGSVMASLLGHAVWVVTLGGFSATLVSAFLAAAGAVLIPGAPAWIAAVVAFVIYPFGGDAPLRHSA